MRRLALGLWCGLLASTAAGAQQDTVMQTLEGRDAGPRPFTVTPYIGAQMYDKASALKSGTPVVGLDVMYRLRQMFGVGMGLGLTLSAARPETDATYFPMVRLEEGPVSTYYRVSQRLTQYTYGAQLIASLPTVARFVPYLSGSGGGYLFDMNAQEVGRTTRYKGWAWSFGGGANVQVGPRTGFSFDIRDMVLFEYDRNRLDATDPLLRDPRFDPVRSGVPAPKNPVHNFRFSVGVSFIPDSKEGAR